MRITLPLLLVTVFIVYCESIRIRPVLKTYKVGLLRRYAPFRIRPALRKGYYGYGNQGMSFRRGYGGFRPHGGYRPGMSFGTLSRGYGPSYGGGRSFMRRPYSSKKSYGRKVMPRRKIIPLPFGNRCGKYQVLICKKYTKNRCYKVCGFKGCQVRCTCGCGQKPRRIIRKQRIQRKRPQIQIQRVIGKPKHITQHINILPNKFNIPLCGKKTFLRCGASKKSHLSNRDCSNTCMVKKVCQQGCVCKCLANNFLGQGVGGGGSGFGGIAINNGPIAGGFNGGFVNAGLDSGFANRHANLDLFNGPVGNGGLGKAGLGNGGLKEENIEVKIDVLSGGNSGVGGIGAGVGITTGGLPVDPTMGIGIGGADPGFGLGGLNGGFPVGILGMESGFGGGADLSGLGLGGNDFGFGQGLGAGVGVDAGNHGLGGIVQDLGLQDLGGLNAIGLDSTAGIGIDGGEGLGNDLGLGGLGLDFAFGGTGGGSGVGIDNTLGLGGQFDPNFGFGGSGVDLGHNAGHGNVGVGVNDIGGGGTTKSGSGVGVLDTGLGGLSGPGVGLGPDPGFGHGPGVGIDHGPANSNSQNAPFDPFTLQDPTLPPGSANNIAVSNTGLNDFGLFGNDLGTGTGGLGSGSGVAIGPDGGLDLSGIAQGLNLNLNGFDSALGLGPDPGLGGPDPAHSNNQAGHGTGVGIDHGPGVGIDHGTGVGIDHGPGVGIDHGPGVGIDHGPGVGIDHGPGVGIDHGPANSNNQNAPFDPFTLQDPTLPPGGGNNIAVNDMGLNGLFSGMGTPGFGLDMNPNDALNFPM